MKNAFRISSSVRLILVISFVLALSACTAPAASPTAPATLPPTVEPTVTLQMATIRGTITYQGMPTPASMLYFISRGAILFARSANRRALCSVRVPAAGWVLPDHRLSCWHTGPGCPAGGGLLAGRFCH